MIACRWSTVLRAAVLTAALTVTLGSARAAAQDEISEQIWVDYNPRLIWPSAFEVYGDMGLRTEVGSQGWGRVVVRPAVRGPVGRFRVGGGLGTFYTFNENEPNHVELRPFQGINWTWPTGRIPLDHYVRIEERFDFETADWTLDASIRVRYRLQTEIRFGAFQQGASWRFIAHAEAFGTIAGNAGQFDEKFRLGVGVERGFVIGIRMRFDVTWQKVGAPFSGAATDDLYFRFRVFQRWLK